MPGGSRGSFGEPSTVLTFFRFSRTLRLSMTSIMVGWMSSAYTSPFGPTRDDSRSVNHAVLGAKVLLERNVLRDLPERERSFIVRAVALHNVFVLPPRLDREIRLHAEIVRDADKLDIWRVFIELADSNSAAWPSAVALGLPDTPECSPAVIAALNRREMVRLTSLRTLNDFRLLQLAWIYDLNFAPSLLMVLERSVIEQLTASLPQIDAISRVVGHVRNYVSKRLDAPRPR